MSSSILPTTTKRKPLIAGNWKMHGARTQVGALLAAMREQALPTVELVVLPPFVFLEQTERLLTGSTVIWGAQDVCANSEGAYTGEISAKMLLEFGCRYVLVGHSERRTLYGEDNSCIAAKFQRAVQAGLIPILCVGETLAERKAGHAAAVIKKQLDVVIECQLQARALTMAVVAYEPVWAIGSGVAATPEQAQAMHALIRTHVAHYDAQIAAHLRILYGGSVKPENAAALFAMPDIDGGLIGKASLNAAQFLDIATACNNLS